MGCAPEARRRLETTAHAQRLTQARRKGSRGWTSLAPILTRARTPRRTHAGADAHADHAVAQAGVALHRAAISVAVRIAPVARQRVAEGRSRPPSGLTFAGSIPSWRITASACAAKASLSSVQPSRPAPRQHAPKRAGWPRRADAHDLGRHAGHRETGKARDRGHAVAL